MPIQRVLSKSKTQHTYNEKYNTYITPWFIPSPYKTTPKSPRLLPKNIYRSRPISKIVFNNSIKKSDKILRLARIFSRPRNKNSESGSSQKSDQSVVVDRTANFKSVSQSLEALKISGHDQSTETPRLNLSRKFEFDPIDSIPPPPPLPGRDFGLKIKEKRPNSHQNLTKFQLTKSPRSPRPPQLQQLNSPKLDQKILKPFQNYQPNSTLVPKNMMVSSTFDPIHNQNYKLWTKSQVSVWLKSINLGHFVENFYDQEIEGCHLKFLDDDNLEKLGLREKFLRRGPREYGQLI